MEAFSYYETTHDQLLWREYEVPRQNLSQSYESYDSNWITHLVKLHILLPIRLSLHPSTNPMEMHSSHGSELWMTPHSRCWWLIRPIILSQTLDSRTPGSISNVKCIFGSKNLWSTNNKSKYFQKLKIINIYFQLIKTLFAGTEYIHWMKRISLQKRGMQRTLLNKGTAWVNLQLFAQYHKRRGSRFANHSVSSRAAGTGHETLQVP